MLTGKKVLDQLRNSHQKSSNGKKRLCWSLFLIKLQSEVAANFIKKTPTQVFSCEYCEIFKNTYFEEHL